MNNVIGVSLVSFCLVLAGCGGGGGANVKKFTKWTDLGPAITPAKPTILTFTGDAVTSDVTVVNGDITAISGGLFAPARTNLTYDGNGDLIVVKILTDSSTLTWNSGASDVITDTGTVITLVSASGNDYGLLADSIAMGHEYQGFGAWITGYSSGTSTGELGAVSLGAQTAPGDVPTSHSATFTGQLLGNYVSSSGADVYTVTADTSLVVDFRNQDVVFSSSNTSLTNIATQTGAVPTPSDLDLSGNLSYTAGSNGFTGSIVSTGGLNGGAQGNFYGPAAEEVGGVFQLDGSGSENYTGAFGAKR